MGQFAPGRHVVQGEQGCPHKIWLRRLKALLDSDQGPEVAAGRLDKVRASAYSSLDAVSRFAYHEDVTASELRRKLARLGCTFGHGTNHLVVYYKGNRTLMPRHPGQEIKTGTYHGILKKLGIKE